MQKWIAGLLAVMGASGTTVAAEVEEAFQQGSVDGYIRSHYNMRDYANQPDSSAFALGGGLKAETAELGWARLGAAFYTAQDLNFNPDDPARIEGRMGSDLDVLGEAYLTVSQWDTAVTVGRQKFFTPLANPIDVFLAPFTFEGMSVKNTGIPGLTLEMDYITAIKGGNSEDFIDVGIWTTQRLGVDVTPTGGTLALGGNYKREAMDLQAWYYNFDDLFDTYYLQSGYAFTGTETVKPFVAAQYLHQTDAGEALLGKVDTQVYGVQTGATWRQAKLVLGYNHVAEQEDAFRNGAFLAPYNFSTSPLFTNNMLQALENVDAGDAVKVSFFYSFPAVELKVSHTRFDLANEVDRGATDIDVIYDMSRFVDNLSLRYRLELVNSDSDAVEQSDQRFQVQYVF